MNVDIKYNKVNVKFKKLHEDAIVPKYAYSTDACFDLHALEGGELRAHRSVLVKTGLAYALPEDFEIQVRPRSGLAYKNMLTVLNSPGTIDEDYRGDLGVILINHSNSVFRWEAGDRIAQGALKPVFRADFEEVDDLDTTDRGEGNFGSTGIEKK